MPDGVDLVSPSSRLAADANGDGSVTIGDLPGWLAQLFFLPGDWALWAIASYAPPLAGLLGDPPRYGGFVSGFVATVFWLLVLIALGTGYAYAVDFDRRATRAASGFYGEVRRVLCVAARRLRARLRRVKAN
jgi:hypothetical protein